MPINDKIDQNKRKLMLEEWKGEADLVKADNMSQIGERSLDSIFRVLSSIRIQVARNFQQKKKGKKRGMSPLPGCVSRGAQLWRSSFSLSHRRESGRIVRKWNEMQRRRRADLANVASVQVKHGNVLGASWRKQSTVCAPQLIE